MFKRWIEQLNIYIQIDIPLLFYQISFPPQTYKFFEQISIISPPILTFDTSPPNFILYPLQATGLIVYNSNNSRGTGRGKIRSLIQEWRNA